MQFRVKEVKWAGHCDEVDEEGKITSSRRWQGSLLGLWLVLLGLMVSTEAGNTELQTVSV